MQVIEFRNFSKYNGEFNLHNLSFQVESGYITGLIGPTDQGRPR
jgi:ABC-type multidrug transport system ATPase subunit